MKRMSEKCFVCEKPSVLCADFIATEIFSTSTKTVHYIRTSSEEKVFGVIRMTLCAECLKRRLTDMIADNLNIFGKPKLFEKKTVESLRLLQIKMESGIFENTPEMEKIFTSFTLPREQTNISFGDNESFNIRLIPIDKKSPEMRQLLKNSKTETYDIPYHDIPEHLRTPLMKRIINRVFEPPYVLWVEGHGVFEHRIEPTLDKGGYKSKVFLFPIHTYDHAAPLFFRKESVNKMRDIAEYYKSNLSML